MDLTAEEKEMLLKLMPTDEAPPTAAPSAQPSQAAQSGLTAEEMSLLSSLAAEGFDEKTGELKTNWTSGVDPDLASNESILDMSDRAKLSLGNVEGNVNYLKEKYGNAALNSRGDITFQKDGKWYYADPSGTDYTKDPWELTKDILADSIGAGIVAGSAIGAGAYSGGMASVPGAVAGEYMRTSLGRLVGTYEADPIQQTRDIALEGIFQLAGEKFLPGAKVGIKKLGQAIEKVGDMAKVQPGAKSLLKWWSSMSVGDEVAETAITYNKQVNKKMQQLGAMAGTDTATYQQVARKDMVEQTKNLAKEAPKILSSTYKRLENNIMNAVDGSFEGNVKDIAFQAHAKMVDDGIAKLVRTRVPAETAKTSVTSQLVFGKAPPAAETLSRMEDVTNVVERAKIMAYVKQFGKLPEGTAFQLKTQSELAQDIAKTGDFSNNALKLTTDVEAYALMQKLFKTVDVAADTPNLRGKLAAKNMLGFKREMGDILWGLSSKADDLGLNAMRKSFMSYSDMVDQNVKGALDKVGQGGMYSQLNATWSQLNNELKPLTKSYRQYLENGNDAVFETFLNKYQSMPGKNGVTKNAVDSLSAAARSLGDDSAARFIDNTRTQIKITQAAAAFNPYLTGKGTASLGMGTFAMMMGNGPLAVALAVGGAAGSPKIAKHATNTSVAMFKQLQFLKGLSTKEINALALDPVKASALINSVVDASATSTMLQEQLMPSADAQENMAGVAQLQQLTQQSQASASRPWSPPANSPQIKDQIKDIAGAGWIAAQMESEGRPGANNLNLAKRGDDPGGASFGMYMFNKQNTMDYMKKSRFATEFKGMNLNTPAGVRAVAQKFKEIEAREPVQFAQDQTEYKEKYITSTIKSAARKRIPEYDTLPLEVRSAIESSGVQFGDKNTHRFILDAAKNSETMAPKEVLVDIAVRKALAYRANKKLKPHVQDSLVKSRSILEPAAILAGDKSGAKESSPEYKEIKSLVEAQDKKLKHIANQRGGDAALWRLREKNLNATQVREAIDFTYKQFGGK